MLISVQGVTKGFLDQLVLKDITLEINAGDRIGLLGVNGAGKTTLLDIIAGRLEPDEGGISRARGLRVGYLEQNDALDVSRTLEEEARDAFSEVYAVQAEMEGLAAELAERPEDAKLLAEYDRLVARFEALDGYHTADKTDRVLNGLGFGGFDRATGVATLSGGEKMRFAIAKMLLQEPDVLILDEPTNHLDFSMLGWLEGYLATYRGAVLCVSHDRYFLDAVAKDICEIERGVLTRYKGGYASFVVQKAERYKVALRHWEKQQEEIAKLEEFVRKNLAKSASVNGVGTRVKALEKMERLEKPIPMDKSISLRFDYDVEPFSTILECEGLGVAFDGRALFSGVDIAVRRGDKVALVGLNGVGKSTFLKAIQDLKPHTGRVRWGGNVRIGYFDQELAGLPLDKSVLEAVHSRYPTKTEYEIRSALGRLLLEGEDAFKLVRDLSGAQRAKVAFAILLMQRANVLILDEPTNHLDYKAKEALEAALRRFEGTLIVVSHDRYFLRQVPDRILEMRPDRFDVYNGNYDYYLEKKTEAEAARLAAEQAQKQERLNEAAKDGGYRTKQQRAAEAQRRQRISALEAEIARLEDAVAGYNAQLAAPEVAADYQKLAEVTGALEADTAALDVAMEEWVELTGE